MKKLSCFTIIIFLSLTLGANPVRSRLKPVSPVVRPIKKFIPIKQEFKHIRATPLPIKDGQIDRREMVLRASLASSEVVSYLNTNQKRTMQSVIQLLKGNNTSSAQREWNSLIESFKKVTQPKKKDGILYLLLDG